MFQKPYYQKVMDALAEHGDVEAIEEYAIKEAEYMMMPHKRFIMEYAKRLVSAVRTGCEI